MRSPSCAGIDPPPEPAPRPLAHPEPVRELPILYLSLVRRCNHRCAMCDLWREGTRDELALADLRRWVPEWPRLAVRSVVLTGGEPLLHSQLAPLAALVAGHVGALGLITNGALLARHAATVAAHCTSLRVSLDGPPAVHDAIRGVARAFDRLRRGLAAVRELVPELRIGARCTVQAGNFRHLRETVDTARELGLDYISFGAVDFASSAFGRAAGWSAAALAAVRVPREELSALADELTLLAREQHSGGGRGFVAEPPEQLQRDILQHYRALHGLEPFPAQRCNAPWVSAVIQHDGTVRPCFFQHPVANLHRSLSLERAVNSPSAIRFRSRNDVPRNRICRACVCPIRLPACACGWSQTPPYCDATTCASGLARG